MMLKKFFNWLLAPERNVHYLWLNKRAHIVGAQFAYATLVLLQPVIMVGTMQTAISRFDDEHGLLALALGFLAFAALLLLILDAWLSFRDWTSRSGLTGTRLSVWLDRVRPWLLRICALWSIGLMSTSKAEAGAVGMLLYMAYFGLHAGVALGLDILDGCQVNKRQKIEYQRAQGSEVRDAAL